MISLFSVLFSIFSFFSFFLFYPSSLSSALLVRSSFVYIYILPIVTAHCYLCRARVFLHYHECWNECFSSEFYIFFSFFHFFVSKKFHLISSPWAGNHAHAGLVSSSVSFILPSRAFARKPAFRDFNLSCREKVILKSVCVSIRV